VAVVAVVAVVAMTSANNIRVSILIHVLARAVPAGAAEWRSLGRR
jgi:hypothetical protein